MPKFEELHNLELYSEEKYWNGWSISAFVRRGSSGVVAPLDFDKVEIAPLNV